MQRTDRNLAIALTIAFGGVFLSFAVPLSSTSQKADWAIIHLDVALTVLYSTFYSIAALLFLSGLKSFKQALRTAYVRLSSGVVLFGAAFAQLLVVGLFNLWGSWWVTSGLVIVPFITAGLLLYWGVRKYAALVGVKSRWMRFWFVLALAVAGGALSGFLPHAALDVPETEFDVSTGLEVAMMLLIFAAAMVTLRIKRHTGAVYTNALAWLFLAFWAVVAAVAVVLTLSFMGFGNDPLGYLAMDFMLLIGGILFIRAGYAFNKLSGAD
jgi:hypothetical protein